MPGVGRKVDSRPSSDADNARHVLADTVWTYIYINMNLFLSMSLVIETSGAKNQSTRSRDRRGGSTRCRRA